MGRALARLVWGLLSAAWLVACDSQFADPVVGASGQNSSDPCSAWTTAETCVADQVHGCSVQPNPTPCDPKDCPSITCQGGDPFVRRSGPTLWLHAEPFRFAGVNMWGIAWSSDCRVGGFDTQQAALDQTFHDLSAMRVGVIRFFAYQAFAGPSGTDYSSFDRIVASARRAGVRVIPVLESMWGNCSKGGQRDDDWFRTGYAAPYGGYALSLPDYARGLVQHFRDEPDVLAWELMHEAGGTDFTALDGFVDQMSTLIRVNDPNHLIVPGVNNGDSPATSVAGSGANYSALHAHATVDLLDVHDFSAPNTPLTALEFSDQGVAVALDKPVFVGAMAVSLSDDSAGAFAQRANEIGAKIDAAFTNGFSGTLVYDYDPNWSTLGTSFDARSGEPLAGANGVVAGRVSRYLGP